MNYEILTHNTQITSFASVFHPPPTRSRRSSKPPYEEFVDEFKFLRVVGVGIEGGGRRGEVKEGEEEEEEVIVAHEGEGLREEVKRVLVERLRRRLERGGEEGKGTSR